MSRCVCGSSDTTSRRSPPPSPVSSCLDICTIFDQIPSLSGVQTSTEYRSIFWGTYNLSHRAWLLLLAHQGLPAHTLTPSFWLACGTGVMPEDAPHGGQSGCPFGSAEVRCMVGLWKGWDDLVKLILVMAYQNSPDCGCIGGWQSLEQTSRCPFMGFLQAKWVTCLLVWSVWGREGLSYTWRFSCPCKYAPER